MQYHIVCMLLLMISIKVYVMSQKFCGDNLTNILSRYCLSYNSPGHRVKRQIINECCHNPCSLEYLLTNYCERYNKEALESYLEERNRINKEKRIQNENFQEGSEEGYLHRTDQFPQVRENYSPRYSQIHQLEHVHNSQRNDSFQHLRTASHERKRRKTKSCHNKNKNSKKRNAWETSDLVVKTAPEAKLGQIEDSQKPIYIFKHNLR